jgi:hypothetical protein
MYKKFLLVFILFPSLLYAQLDDNSIIEGKGNNKSKDESRTSSYFYGAIVNTFCYQDFLGKRYESTSLYFFNGFEFFFGKYLQDKYYLGVNTGFNSEYHKAYADARINNMPLYFSNRLYFINKSVKFSVNINLGKNIVLNSVSDTRPYGIHGKYYFSSGIGAIIPLQYVQCGSMILDIEYELKKYSFSDYLYDSTTLRFIKIKLGFII